MKHALPILLACTAMVSTSAFAQAAPTAGDIAALRSQIEALQAELNQLQAAQQAQAAQVAKVAAAPVPVPPKPEAPGWWGGTTISGKAYVNVSNIDQTSTDLAGNKTDNVQNGTQTELKRFYVGIDHKFNDTFSANITTDFRYNANGASKDVLIYVKKAYLQAKLSPAFFVRVGSADLPWVPFTEGLYGYRFVENTLTDRTKFGTSADWGVHIGGTVANGLVSYAASAINGAGYKTLSRSSDTIDLEGRVSVNPIKEITLGGRRLLRQARQKRCKPARLGTPIARPGSTHLPPIRTSASARESNISPRRTGTRVTRPARLTNRPAGRHSAPLPSPLNRGLRLATIG